MPLRIEPPLYRRRVDFYTQEPRLRHHAGPRPSWATRPPSISKPACAAPSSGIVSRHGCEQASQRRPDLRSPRMDRFTHARREAPVRVDDPALRSASASTCRWSACARRISSDDTLEQFGIDVTYLASRQVRSGDAARALKVLDDKKADIVHLHGYGATTFGRICAAMRARFRWFCTSTRITRHAVVPEGRRTGAGAVHGPRDRGVAVDRGLRDRARKMPAERTKVVYLGVPLEEFARPRIAGGSRRGPRAISACPTARFAIGTITRLMPSKGNTLSGRRPSSRSSNACPQARIYHRRRRRARARRCRREAKALGTRRSPDVLRLQA